MPTTALKPTVGRIIHCWPEKHGPPNTGPDQAPATLVCAGIICGVFPDAPGGGLIAVHYFMPDGSNGSCELPIDTAAGEPSRGTWWWPPRS